MARTKASVDRPSQMCPTDENATYVCGTRKVCVYSIDEFVKMWLVILIQFRCNTSVIHKNIVTAIGFLQPDRKLVN